VLDRPTAIPPSVAADGVDEYLDVFVRTRGKQTLTAPLHLEASDAGRSWVVAPAPKPGRIVIDADGDDPIASMTGPAMDLLLTVWNRVTVAETAIDVTGDEAVAASFRE
jgi:hypothetical protein